MGYGCAVWAHPETDCGGSDERGICRPKRRTVVPGGGGGEVSSRLIARGPRAPGGVRGHGLRRKLVAAARWARADSGCAATTHWLSRPSVLVAAGALTLAAGTGAAVGSCRSAAPARGLGLAGMVLGFRYPSRPARHRALVADRGGMRSSPSSSPGGCTVGCAPGLLFMILAAVSAAWAVPNAATVVGASVLTLGAEMQTVSSRSPLRRAHGDSYNSYARRTGRFLPGIGRLAQPQVTAGDRWPAR